MLVGTYRHRSPALLSPGGPYRHFLGEKEVEMVTLAAGLGGDRKTTILQPSTHTGFPCSTVHTWKIPFPGYTHGSARPATSLLTPLPADRYLRTHAATVLKWTCHNPMVSP